MRKIVLSFSVLFLSYICQGQKITIPEPEFSGTIVFVKDSATAGMSLETTKIVLKTKASASVYITGIGKAKTKASVKGTTSTAMVDKDSTIYFIYKAADNTINPADVIQLIRFTVKGGNRETDLASAGTFTGSSSGDIGFVQFTAKKYKTSSYLIAVTDLAPGEYGFSLGKEESTTVHMFTLK